MEGGYVDIVLELIDTGVDFGLGAQSATAAIVGG